MTISCLRQSPRARCAPCFERTGFRQPCSLFPSYLRCDSLRSIAACSHNRPSCTCRWPFRQQQQKPALQSQLTAGPQRRKSISIPLCVPPKAIPIMEEMYQCDLPTASRSNCTARLVSIALHRTNHHTENRSPKKSASVFVRVGVPGAQPQTSD